MQMLRQLEFALMRLRVTHDRWPDQSGSDPALLAGVQPGRRDDASGVPTASRFSTSSLGGGYAAGYYSKVGRGTLC